MDQAPVDGWRPKRRLVQQSDVGKHHKKRRPPSYVHTQAMNPEYIRIRKVCDTFEAALQEAGEDEVDAAYRKLCRDLRNHISVAGASLLKTMEDAKKMLLLVAEQKKRVNNLMTNHTCSDAYRQKLAQLLDCFPSRASERNYSVYHQRVLQVERDVETEATLAQKERDERLATKGITRVTWDSDDEYSSGVFYGSTGGAGHGHGGPGL
tara:strand:+ start:722 stop:1345 length:624 start_codon:yes stop_codon:yes gene_type:complete